MNVALFGYSGHAYVVAEAIQLMGMYIIGYYDKVEAETNSFNLRYLGSETEEKTLEILKNKSARFFVGIGENQIRKKVINKLFSLGLQSTKVIHPSSIVSKLSAVGEATFIAGGVKINPLANIGIGTILNTGCIIEHECKIGNYTHIAPSAVLAGNVTVGNESFVGANAVVKQGVSIGNNVIIGAGAVVLKDVPDNAVVIGNPAKFLKFNSQ